MEDEVLKLIPKRKKGLLKIVFSRFGLTVFLFLTEIAVLAVGYNILFEYVRVFAVIQTLFSMAMLLYLFNCDMESSAKLTWLYIITLFPVPASILLLFSKTDLGHRAVKRKIVKMINDTEGMIAQNEEVFSRSELVKSGTDDLCKYLNRSGHFPIFNNTRVTFCPNGEEKHKHLLEELKKAKSFIYLEYFIIDEGYMWGSVLKILADKAKEGVDVRVMYDGMCEANLLPFDYPERMAKLNIKCKPFTPIRPFISSQYNYRDHRKIVVIDGRVAFNGGINLADEYINRVERFGHWKDCAVMLEGEAVRSFTLMFLQMWNITEKVPSWDHMEEGASVKGTQGYVMPYSDCPLDDYKVGETVYMDILYRAKSYVHIMTPYLIIDNEIESALKYAAQRGIDVKIILPGIPDKKTVYALAKNRYKTLLEAGVKLYEYEPGFVHSKVFVSDDEKAVVGTINLDYRSLYHHFECATYMYQTACIGDIEADFNDTLSKCREVNKETIKNEKFIYRVVGTFLKVFETLM